MRVRPPTKKPGRTRVFASGPTPREPKSVRQAARKAERKAARKSVRQAIRKAPSGAKDQAAHQASVAYMGARPGLQKAAAKAATRALAKPNKSATSRPMSVTRPARPAPSRPTQAIVGGGRPETMKMNKGGYVRCGASNPPARKQKKR